MISPKWLLFILIFFNVLTSLSSWLLAFFFMISFVFVPRLYLVLQIYWTQSCQVIPLQSRCTAWAVSRVPAGLCDYSRCPISWCDGSKVPFHRDIQECDAGLLTYPLRTTGHSLCKSNLTQPRTSQGTVLCPSTWLWCLDFFRVFHLGSFLIMTCLIETEIPWRQQVAAGSCFWRMVKNWGEMRAEELQPLTCLSWCLARHLPSSLRSGVCQEVYLKLTSNAFGRGERMNMMNDSVMAVLKSSWAFGEMLFCYLSIKRQRFLISSK